MSSGDFLYNIASACLHNTQLAQQYSIKFHEVVGTNVSIRKTSQCSNCKIPWVPGWNVRVRIEYSSRKRSRNSQKKIIQEKIKDFKPRSRFLVYKCLLCENELKVDGLLIAKEASMNKIENKPIVAKTLMSKQKIMKDVDENKKLDTKNKNNNKNIINTGLIINSKNKKKKKKFTVPKKAEPSKKPSLSLMDFMSSDS